MKVCDVVLNSVWYDPRVRKQLAEYIRRGIDVACVGMKCPRYDAEKVAAIPCKVHIVTIDPKFDGEQRSLWRKIKRERMRHGAIVQAIVDEKPDVIHANDLNALIPAVTAAKKLRCKLVYDAHEINTHNIGTGGLYQRYLIWTEKRLSKKVDRMICVSHAAAEYFATSYGIPLPTVVTNCSLKREAVCTDLPKNGFEVLNHGQFYEGRGYDLMIKASLLLRDCPEVRLALRGFGRIEEQLRSMAQDLNAQNVVFYPRVPVEELIPSAATASVGLAVTEPINLNFRLSVSNKLFEYASAGLPVIMSDIPEHRYLNDAYHFGVIMKENTPEELAKAVRMLYVDKDFYRKCTANARKLSEEINWENEFEKVLFTGTTSMSE